MIDEIIEELESLPNSKAAAKYSEAFTKSQEELVGFLFAALEDCSSEAQETAFFIALVVWSYYSWLGDLKTVDDKAIIEKFDKANGDMQAFENGDERALQKILPDEIENDDVLKFLATELEEAREDGELSADEVGTLFVVLKVLVDCLEEAIINRQMVLT